MTAQISQPPTHDGRRRATPTVLQMEAVECGAACLAMVLAHYGRWETLEKLRVDCGVSRDGSKASNIVKAARQYGLTARGVLIKGDTVFTHGPMPAIVFWNFNHFVVLEGVRGDRVYLNDPGFGPRRLSREEFHKSYSGVVLLFERTAEFRPGGRPPGLFGSLRRHTVGSGDAISLTMLVSLLLVLPGLVMPAGLKAFVDAVMVQNMTGWVLPLVVGLGLAGLLNGLLTWMQQRYLLGVQNKLSLATAGELVWHLFRLPVVFYTQRQAGDIAARVEGCARVAQLLAGPLSTNMVNGAMVVFYAAVMAAISLPLTAAVVGLSTLNLVATKVVQRTRTDLNGRLLNRRARMTAVSISGLQAIETLKATGTEHDFFTKWSGEQANVVEAQQSLGATSFGLDAVPSLLNQLLTAIVLGGGGLLIMEGSLTIGGLVAYQALLGYFTSPIQQLVGFSSQLQEIRGDLTRIDDAMNYHADPVVEAGRPAVSEPALARAGPRIAKLSGALELRDVAFRYGPLDPMLIEDFNLRIQPGARVALVGASGSGKSTLGRLIVGLYPQAAGDVTFDGRPISEIPREVFTTSVAYVDQEISLFEGTVFDNIAMWDPAVPFERVRAAARDACIDDVIAARPGGYRSRVDEGGGNFSGGQRQRIEIARALVHDPRLIVLDEATAALDPLTEQQIDRNLRRRGCTCVIVAHRLSTIRDADEIIVLERGRVIERGNHEALLTADGRYAQLARLA